MLPKSRILELNHLSPEKVKKMAITGANLVPDTTAVPQEILDMVTPALMELKNKPTKSLFVIYLL